MSWEYWFFLSVLIGAAVFVLDWCREERSFK